jgi:hypothetical protein
MEPPSDSDFDVENGPDEEPEDDISSLKGSDRRQLFRGRVGNLFNVAAIAPRAYASSHIREHQRRGQIRRRIPPQQHHLRRSEDVCSIYIDVTQSINLTGF